MPPLGITAFTLTTALGTGIEPNWQALIEQRSGLRRNDLPHCHLDTYIGRVAEVEQTTLPAPQAVWDCRNNRLAWLGLNQDGFLAAAQATIAQYGPERVALVLGTSTFSMASTEAAYRRYAADTGFAAADCNPKVHAPNSLVGFVAEALGLTGPQITVATACSSSARVFGSAQRLLQAGVVDAAIVGGVDSLCLSVMYGFHALELMSSQPCQPFDQARAGLNIGEAAGFAILERRPAPWLLAGYGESSDAYHMSSPHPEGIGAQQAMQAALARAGIDAAQIGYINLHGTATKMNDAIEAHAIRQLFAAPVACASTKGWTGHTLGAAGIVEAIISLLVLQHGVLPPSLYCTDPEAAMHDYVLRAPVTATPTHVMSNSFGFGGNNCALVFAAPGA